MDADPQPHTVGAGEPAGRRAWLDVRKGRVWPGARVPGEASVVDGALLFTITERRHERKERLAISRLGPDRLAAALGRDALVLRFPLAEADLHFPTVPMLGRSGFRVRMDGLPDVGISFLELGDPGRTTPYRLLWRGLSRGREARRKRDALRAEIEASVRKTSILG